MVYTKKPGVYFTESVGKLSVTQQEIPLFIVQTSTALAIDGEYTLYNDIESFKAIAEDKGLNKTIEYIEQALYEIGTAISFYVYSIKTDTPAAFTKVITDSDNIPEIKTIYYIEETKSSSSNTIVQKSNALQLGCINSHKNGINKLTYVVPYGSVTDVYANAESDAVQKVVTTLKGYGESVSGNRLGIINPDNLAGAVIGKIFNTPYNEDVGYSAISTPVSDLTYQYTDSQELTLLNAGILLITSEIRQGIKINRIILGVSTATSTNAADGQLIVRRIADQVLNDIKEAADVVVKAQGSEQNIVFLQTDVNTIIDRYVELGELKEAESVLTVSADADGITFYVTGTLKPARAVVAVEVNTNIK